jgi:hypothetical protein
MSKEAVNCPAADPPPVSVDARVARLEAYVEVLSERIERLPSKGFFVASNMTAVALLSAVIIFREELQALLGM